MIPQRIVDKIDPPRFFPLVGMAQLHHCHWKCIVYYTETTESNYPFPFHVRRPRIQVLLIDKDHLHLYPCPTPEALTRRDARAERLLRITTVCRSRFSRGLLSRDRQTTVVPFPGDPDHARRSEARRPAAADGRRSGPDTHGDRPGGFAAAHWIRRYYAYPADATRAPHRRPDGTARVLAARGCPARSRTSTKCIAVGGSWADYFLLRRPSRSRGLRSTPKTGRGSVSIC